MSRDVQEIGCVVHRIMSIEIKLNKPDNRYIAGELLQGSVTLNTPKDEKVRCKLELI